MSQLAGVLSGAATIVLTGVLARRVTDDTTALFSAGLVALSPLLIAADGSMMSETPFVPVALGLACTVAVVRERNQLWLWASAGALVAAVTLTRADGLVLFVCLVVPAAVLGRGGRRTRIVRAATAALVAAAVLTPWVARNAIRVHEATIATISSSTAIGGANCDATYSGAAIGAWDFACTHPELSTTLDEHAWSKQNLHDGLRYITGHSSRLPLVVVARLARLSGAWPPTDQAKRETLETRNRHWQMLADLTSPIVVLAGLVGISLMGRRRRRIAPLIGLVASSAIVAVLGYGNTRFRTTAEPALLIGAAYCITAATRKLIRPHPNVDQAAACTSRLSR